MVNDPAPVNGTVKRYGARYLGAETYRHCLEAVDPAKSHSRSLACERAEGDRPAQMLAMATVCGTSVAALYWNLRPAAAVNVHNPAP